MVQSDVGGDFVVVILDIVIMCNSDLKWSSIALDNFFYVNENLFYLCLFFNFH